MKRFSFMASIGLLTAAMASSSLAADLSRRVYKAAPAPAYAAPFSWTGLYVGINGGYGFGKSRWTTSVAGLSTGDFDTKGGLAGGTLGYNMQTGLWVWGLEGDLDASWMKGTVTTFCGGTGCTTNNTWLGTGRARIGYAMGRWLPYATAGAAVGGIKMTPPSPDTYTAKTKFGWTAGLGVEYAFSGPWSAKLEYLYVDLGKTSCGSATCLAAGGIDVKYNTNIVRAGVNYRF